MLRIVHCHGKTTPDAPLGDFIAIVDTAQELLLRPLTSADVIKYSTEPIAFLTCISENRVLNALSNIVYPILKKDHDERSALTLLKGLIQRSIELSHQVRRQVVIEALPSGE